METLNRASSTLIIFHFRGLVVLSRNSRNMNSSKITRDTVLSLFYQLFTILYIGSFLHTVWRELFEAYIS